MAQESIESSVIIHRSVEEVFAFVENPENSPRWEGVESKRLDGELKEGTKVHVVTNIMGKRVEATATLIEVIPNRLTRFQATTPFSHVVEHHYEPIEEGTKFTRKLVTDPKEAGGFAKFAKSLMLNAAVKATRKSVEDLKELLEKTPAN